MCKTVHKKHIISKRTANAIDEFDANIFEATNRLFVRWEREEYYMTVAQTSVKVLFFRNSHIWESWRTLLSQGRHQGSEFLLRSLFEGVITFEWCLKDIDTRGFRFRRTTWESTAEFYELKGDSDCDYVKNLHAAATWAKEKGLARMPNIRQMAEELYPNDAEKKYAFFKYLSKIVHGMFEVWGKYEQRPGILYPDPNDTDKYWSYIQDKSMGSYLQMQNIEFMGILFEPMYYEGINDLKRQWNFIYSFLLEDERQ